MPAINPVGQRPIGQIQGAPDLTKITPVQIQGQPVISQAYQIPLYASMTLKDGSTADVLVNVVQVTKEQLKTAIDRGQKAVDDAQAQLDAIVALEASGVGVEVKP
jgi:hypothetical protein